MTTFESALGDTPLSESDSISIVPSIAGGLPNNCKLLFKSALLQFSNFQS